MIAVVSFLGESKILSKYYSTKYVSACVKDSFYYVFVFLLASSALDQAFTIVCRNFDQVQFYFWPYQFTLTVLQWSVIIKIHTDKWWWLRTLKDIYKSNCSWSILICQVYPLCQMIINTSLFKRLKVSNFPFFFSLALRWILFINLIITNTINVIR